MPLGYYVLYVGGSLALSLGFMALVGFIAHLILRKLDR